MNNVQDMFSALFKPFNRSTSVEQRRHDRDRSPVGGPGCHGNDREEDDFLLVGQTQSERTTVYAGQFSNKVNGPPSYERAMSVPDDERLPSYAEYSSSEKEYSPWLAAGIGNDNTSVSDTSIMGNHDNSLSFPAVADIPFTLSPELQLRIDLMKCSADINLIRQQTLDLSKFNYDFSVENSVLREHEMSLYDS